MKNSWIMALLVVASCSLTSCITEYKAEQPPPPPPPANEVAWGDLTFPRQGVVAASASPDATATVAAVPAAPPVKKTPKKSREEYEAMTNPHPGDAASAERGKAIFLAKCASCHGKDGKGDGPAAEMLNPKPRNYVEEQFKYGDQDSHIFATIQLGSPPTAMASWHDKIPDDQMWDLVNYVKTFRKK